MMPSSSNFALEMGGRALADTRAARRARLLAAAAAAAVLAWAGLVFTVPAVRFVVVAPKAKTGFEVTLALLGIFTAVVLVLFPAEGNRDRLRWVGLGFTFLGLGGLGFGYLLPLVRSGVNLDTAMYGSLLARTLATLAMAAGLALARPPSLPGLWAAAAVCGSLALGVDVALQAGRLPPLADVASLEVAAAGSATVMPGLTAWHWTASTVPIIAAVAVAVGAVRHYPGRAPTGWLAVAMVLMAGSQLHTAFWPSAYSPILTTASLLRLASTVAVATGGLFELNRIAAERGDQLAAAEATAERAAHLARARADFTEMVAHEFASPLAAVRRAAERLATEPLSPTQQSALATIDAQIGLLGALVADARSGAEDFPVYPFAVPLDLLLAEAVAYAGTLSGDHPFACDLARCPRVRVRADPERIAQVLHNLLDNAAKYSPPDTPIGLEATPAGARIRVAVTDRGPGIHPDEVPVVFARFGRGRDAVARGIEGTGLGLYLAERIVRAHGGELRVDSVSGSGATFWFLLEVAP